MDEIFKSLFESELFTDETKETIKEAFSKALEEAKEKQEANLRAEFAKRFEDEKSTIRAALEQFVENNMKEPVAELREGLNEISKMKSVYADKEARIVSEARKYIKERLSLIEAVIESVIRPEIEEVHESEVENRRAYLNAITEVKSQAATDRENFKTKAAAVLEEIINVKLNNLLETMKTEIENANKSDFGRQIYEAFYSTFQKQHFNSDREFKNIKNVLNKTRGQLKELSEKYTKNIMESDNRVKIAEQSERKLREQIIRRQTINKLLNNLEGGARTRMKTILENTSTSKIKETYKKQLNNVLKNANKDKNKINENRQILDDDTVEIKTGGINTSQKVNENTVEKYEDEDVIELSKIIEKMK